MIRPSGRLHDLDLALFRAVARWHSPALDQVLPPLSRLADHGVLWGAVAAGLAAPRGRSRRSAVRGLISLTIASGVTNTVLKAAAGRRRPALDAVLAARRLRTQPRTSSFPSGHAASAAAFTVGASLELGWPGLPLLALGSAVAFSRIYTGVHYPGDVAAGVAVGTAVSLATLRAWPVHPERPATVRGELTLPPRPAGAGVTVVVNPASGPDDDTADRLRQLLPDARLVAVAEGEDLADVLYAAAGDAEVLGIAGGDGSVGCAMQVAAGRGLPLAVVPAGTYNHFARDLGISSAGDTARALASGQAGHVDVGCVGDRPFVNTVSIGGYPEMVVLRDRLAGELGTLPAAAVAAIRTLATARPHELLIDGRQRRVWMLFCGNCTYQPPGLAPVWRERLDDGLLDVRLISAERPLGRTRFVASLVAGRLTRSRVYERWTAERVEVRAAAAPFRFAWDGETSEQPTRHLSVTKRGQVTVLRPVVG